MLRRFYSSNFATIVMPPSFVIFLPPRINYYGLLDFWTFVQCRILVLHFLYLIPFSEELVITVRNAGSLTHIPGM